MTYWQGHALAPALKICCGCGQRRVDIRKRSTFVIAYSGRLICRRCATHAARL